MKERGKRRLAVRHYRDAEDLSVLAKKSPKCFESYCSIDMIMLRSGGCAISRQKNYTNLSLLNGTF